MDTHNAAEMSRTAWRILLIPLIGSAAFFSTSLAGVIRTHQKYGWPKEAFTFADYFLISLPFIIIPLTLYESVKNGRKREELE